MKILHVIPSVSPLRGGPSKAIIEMVSALKDEGIEVEIATTNDHGPNELDVPLKQLTPYHGVSVRFFKRYSPAITPLREFAFSNDFRQWLKQHIDEYDLIHVHAIFSFTSSYTMRLAYKRDIPYIVRPIGQLEMWALQQSTWRKRCFLAGFERANLMRAAGVHFTADSEQAQALLTLSRLNQTKTGFILPLGVQTCVSDPQARSKLLKQHGLHPDQTVILYLSRLHPKKGLELLLKALAEHETRHWHLLIAGDGDLDYTADIKRLIGELNLEHRCQLLGFTEGARKQLLLQGADLYALTSYSENFGIAVLEALAAGTPALVSHSVALSTFINTNGIGYVCDVTVPSISQTLETAFEDNKNSSQRAAQCIQQHYAWPPLARRLIDIYQRCIDRLPIN